MTKPKNKVKYHVIKDIVGMGGGQLGYWYGQNPVVSRSPFLFSIVAFVPRFIFLWHMRAFESGQFDAVLTYGVWLGLAGH